jgi:hypothetical protein
MVVSAECSNDIPPEVELVIKFLNLNHKYNQESRENLIVPYQLETFQNSDKKRVGDLFVKRIDAKFNELIMPNSRIEISLANRSFYYNNGEIWNSTKKNILLFFVKSDARWDDPYLVVSVSITIDNEKKQMIDVLGSTIDGKNL